MVSISSGGERATEKMKRIVVEKRRRRRKRWEAEEVGSD